jgi:hypothetical protein
MVELDSDGPGEVLRQMEDLVARGVEILEGGVRVVPLESHLETLWWVFGKVSYAETAPIALDL